MARLENKRPKHLPPPRPKGDFDIICCEITLRAVSFVRLHCNAGERTVSFVAQTYKSNKSYMYENKPHGEILSEYFDALMPMIDSKDVKVAVCRRLTNKFTWQMFANWKVYAMAEMALWITHKIDLCEMTVKDSRRILTGDEQCSDSMLYTALHKNMKLPQFKRGEQLSAFSIGAAWLVQNDFIDWKIPAKKEATT